MLSYSHSTVYLHEIFHWAQFRIGFPFPTVIIWLRQDDCDGRFFYSLEALLFLTSRDERASALHDIISGADGLGVAYTSNPNSAFEYQYLLPHTIYLHARMDTYNYTFNSSLTTSLLTVLSLYSLLLNGYVGRSIN